MKSSWSSCLDRLYQLPLAEFTRARAELARGAGSNAAAIRRLQKPNLPAWAVNQLYWRERAAYDSLIAAAEHLRAVQVAALSGKQANVAHAEAEHARARKDGLARIRKILQETGERASAATINAVNETLEALPAGEPGRLARPLKPMGFEALARLLGGRASRRPAPAVRSPSRPDSTSGTPTTTRQRAAEKRRAEREAKQAEEARRREAKRLAVELRDARAAEDKAKATLRRTRAELAKAERTRERAATALEAADADVSALTKQLRRQREEFSAMSETRADIETRLKSSGEHRT